MTEKLDWQNVKAAFLNLSDKEWKILADKDYHIFMMKLLILSKTNFLEPKA